MQHAHASGHLYSAYDDSDAGASISPVRGVFLGMKVHNLFGVDIKAMAQDLS